DVLVVNDVRLAASLSLDYWGLGRDFDLLVSGRDLQMEIDNRGLSNVHDHALVYLVVKSGYLRGNLVCCGSDSGDRVLTGAVTLGDAADGFLGVSRSHRDVGYDRTRRVAHRAFDVARSADALRHRHSGCCQQTHCQTRKKLPKLHEASNLS